jgi:hypothetical protein
MGKQGLGPENIDKPQGMATSKDKYLIPRVIVIKYTKFCHLFKTVARKT